MKNAPLNIIFLISSLVISGIFHISIWIKALNGWQCGICIAFGQVNACGYYIEFLGIEITEIILGCFIWYKYLLSVVMSK